jgi:hypothetical protein
MASITDILNGVLNKYDASADAAGNKKLRIWLAHESARLRALVPDPSVIIKSSIGSGSFAEVPWIGFRLQRLAPNFRSGIYVVYLFSSTNKTVTLCLAQGVTNVGKQRPGLPNPSSRDFPELERRALAIRSIIDPPQQFDLNSLDLGVKGIRGRAYEHGFICGRLYSGDGLPDERTLENDLREMLIVYDSISSSFDSDIPVAISQYERVEPQLERNYRFRTSTNGPVRAAKPIDTEAWRQALERRKQSHKFVLDRIAEAAREADLCFAETSHIDLVVNGHLIIEVKSLLADDVTQVRAAIGQLYYYKFVYRQRYPNAALMAAFSRKPRSHQSDTDLLDFLRECGIVPCWWGGSGFESCDPAAPRWLINQEILGASLVKNH